MPDGRFKSKAAFCACIARGLKPGEAARAIGITRATAYRWKDDDPAFREMWEGALEERTEEAESQLFKLVKEGHFPAIAYALKCWHPEKYDRRVKIALGGDPDGPPIGVASEVVHFFLPANRRDRPEGDEADVIEGSITETGDDKAAKCVGQ
jgi:hypothetical protein